MPVVKSEWCKTHPKQKENARIALERSEYWEKQLSPFPTNVNAEVYFDDLGSTCVRCFVELKNTYDDDYKAIPPTEQETSWIKQWASARTKREGEKSLREKEGKFFYRYDVKDFKDAYGTYDFILFIENPHPMNCKLTKVTKEIEIFEAKC